MQISLTVLIELAINASVVHTPCPDHSGRGELPSRQTQVGLNSQRVVAVTFRYPAFYARHILFYIATFDSK